MRYRGSWACWGGKYTSEEVILLKGKNLDRQVLFHWSGRLKGGGVLLVLLVFFTPNKVK